MATFKDVNDLKFKGLFKVVSRNTKTGKETILEEENLVVGQSRTLMRDLMFDNSTKIKRIQIGDMNKTLSDDLSDLGDPDYNDTALVDAFFSKDFQTNEIVEQDGRPAIKYTFVINDSEANDSNNTDFNRKLWCEYALISTETDSSGNDIDGKIWNRKIKPIIKDNETEITIYWIFIF